MSLSTRTGKALVLDSSWGVISATWPMSAWPLELIRNKQSVISACDIVHEFLVL